jgi:TatA/E family protein of Tat protein translocase
MPNIGPFELIIILFIALIILGPSRLPDLANALGKSIREFRKAATEVDDATNLRPNVLRDKPAPTETPAAGPGEGQGGSDT